MLFSRTYATSHQLEQQRLSSPAGPPVPSLHSSQSRREIPDELRTASVIGEEDPFLAPAADMTGGIETLLEEEQPDLMAFDDVLDDAFDEVAVPPQKKQAEERGTLIDASPIAEQVEQVPAVEAGRPRSDVVVKMLFPSARLPQPASKRLSLPVSQSAASSQPFTKRTSLPGHSSHSSLSSSTSRKTLSSSHASLRSSQTSATSLAAREGTLLALPLADQLRTLKARNSQLAKTLATQQATNAKALERIRQLEEEKESGRVEAEGWEAEAQRLAAELASGSSAPAQVKAPAEDDEKADLVARVALLERQLAIESSKRRRAKEMQHKLRCELVNRRWKEKWEVELLEREERRWEVKCVELEHEAARERYEREMEKLEREELQETVAEQLKSLSALSASRQLLLTSHRTSESTISTLRADLSSLRLELDSTLARLEEQSALVAELEEMKEEVERLRKGEKSGSERGKEAEKERARRERLEAEVKDLKAQLKTTQSALKLSEKTAFSAQSALAALESGLERSSSTVKAGEGEKRPVAAAAAAKRAKKIVEKEPEPEVVEEDEVVSAAEEVATDVESVAALESEPEPEQEQDDEETYKPVKSKSRSAPAPKVPKTAAAPKATKKATKPVVDLADEDDLPTPKKKAAPAADSKNRKAGVLGDKSANVSLSARAVGGGVEGHEGGGVQLKVKKKAKKGVVSRLSLDSDEDEDRPAKRRKDEDVEPLVKKKKKIALFGGPKSRFAFPIENADANSLIPVDLSPIKKDVAKKSSVLSAFGGGGAGRKGASIFA
ncbi:hypothetical protein NBRC10512_004104 [Rhodotorula toruloides]|uniref:RHTO0S03e01376g1_1 n=2 Tax=Rhodotorula toruloides TaxID=5286 RepID=A0A061ATF5_RHOTO|nr:uncharacterized protein RHTO_00096 [Rhodotorula toruloides NP11]EMS25668.1 hypothetical protein RHTO_00096 [Rhodotorula toruloides NP11]CDR37961.1 RHTO0S03e01376g1_1 [Rhodotorula toruloides]